MSPPPRISIRRPVTVAMLFLGVVVFGMKSYQELALNLMPDLSYPSLTVRTEYPEAAPEELENFVSRPLEEALGTVSNLVEIRSISSAGLSEVLLEFAWGTDMDLAALDVREKMDRVFLPEEVARPSILRYNPALDPILRLGVYGDQDLFVLRRIAEKELKPQLEGLPGVASVKVKGGLEQEVLVEVDEGRLAERGLGMEQLTQRLWQENINLAGGSLKEGRAEYLVRTLNEFTDLREIGNVVIGRVGAQAGGAGLAGLAALTGAAGAAGAAGAGAEAEVRIRDVASIRWGHKKQDIITRINDTDSVEVEVYKEADSNTVDVGDRVKAVLGLGGEAPASPRGRKQKEAPEPQGFLRQLAGDYPGVRMKLISDPSRFIKNAIEEVRGTALLGGFLALAVLFLFLRDVKSTLIIGVSIPVSIVMTFIPMFIFGVSLNLMSLGGLALGIGMLVDNSIVVLESIYRCREEGDGVVEAASRGIGEVSAAITSSTLTTVAVFFPIVFVKGIAGQLFNDLALTVTFSLLGSLVVAVYLVPMLASRRVPSVVPEGGGAPAGGAAPGAQLRERARSWLCWVARNGRPDRWAAEMVGCFQGRPPARPALSAPRAGLAPEGAVSDAPDEPPPASRPGPAGRVLLAAYAPVHPLFEAARFLLLLGAGLAAFAGGLLFVLVIRLLAPVLRALAWVLKGLAHPFLYLFERSMEWMRRVYPPVLRWCLGHRFLVVFACLLGAAHCVYLFGGLGTELIPRIHQGQFTLRIEYPVGTPLDETSRSVEPVERLARDEPGVETVFSEIGSEPSGAGNAEGERGENVAEITVTLEDVGRDVFREDVVMDRLRERLRDFVGIQTKFILPSLFGYSTPVEVEIEGNDLVQLRRIAAQVERRMRGIPGLADVRASAGVGNPEVQIQFDRHRLARFGIDANKAARSVQTKLLGDVATRLSEGENRHDIRVRADRAFVKSLEDLRNLKIDIAPGTSVPLDSLAELRIVPGPSEVRRVAQHRVAVVSANLEGMDLGSVSQEILVRLADLELPPGYRIDLGGQNREMQTSFQSLRFALLLAVFLVYIVMASQFESLLHPFVILFSIPMGLIAVVYALFLLEVPLSVVVFIGLIMLAGIMVNDAIVLVDYINVLRKRGMERGEAIVQAGLVRMRPILMTTLTTILGLLPMALGLGEGAEIRVPMAVTVIAGLTGSTFLTLLVIPVVYSLLDRKP